MDTYPVMVRYTDLLVKLYYVPTSMEFNDREITKYLFEVISKEEVDRGLSNYLDASGERVSSEQIFEALMEEYQIFENRQDYVHDLWFFESEEQCLNLSCLSYSCIERRASERKGWQIQDV